MISHSQVRTATPLVAAVFTLPSWYRSLVDHSAPMQQSLIRFAVALPVAWLLLTLIRKASAPTQLDDDTARTPDPFGASEFDRPRDPL